MAVSISTIVSYISSSTKKFYPGHTPEANFNVWVERVGERLAAHPELKPDIIEYLKGIHHGAQQWLATHDGTPTGAMNRVESASFQWLCRMDEVEDPTPIQRDVGILNTLLAL